MENNVFYCQYCGYKVDEGTLFCPKCGKKLNNPSNEDPNAASEHYEEPTLEGIYNTLSEAAPRCSAIRSVSFVPGKGTRVNGKVQNFLAYVDTTGRLRIMENAGKILLPLIVSAIGWILMGCGLNSVGSICLIIAGAIGTVLSLTGNAEGKQIIPFLYKALGKEYNKHPSMALVGGVSVYVLHLIVGGFFLLMILL